MRSPWFVLVFILVMVFSVNVFASDLQYFFSYKNTVSDILEKYQSLQKECKEQTKEECADIEVHARNFLIQKATAYKEYSEGVVGNFESVFSNALPQEAKDEIAQHNAAILDARFLASYAQVQNLPELEKTLNGLINKNEAFLNWLSATFHVYKTQQLYNAFLDTQSGLEKEVVLASQRDLDVGVAKRHMREADESLKNASKLIKKNEKHVKNNELTEIPIELEKNIPLIYKELQLADTSMLKASQILANFAERAYW